MSLSEQRENMGGGPAGLVWRTLVNPSTFVVICLLWCLDLGSGSVVAYLADPNFSAKMDALPFKVWLTRIAPRQLPESFWIYILTALTSLMVLSLLLCSINWLRRRRKHPRFLGEFLVHLGFLLIFAGFVTGAVWGERYQGVRVRIGSEEAVPALGISLHLRDLRVKRGPDGMVLDTVSKLVLRREDGETSTARVRLNHPLIRDGLVIYPRGAAELISAVVFASPTGGRITLAEGATAMVGGRSIRVERLLQQGERFGNVVGPAALVRVDNDAKGRLQVFRFTGRGHRAMIDGLPLVLQGFATATWGNFDVHYDPGIRLVIGGAVILALGIFWALAGYLRKKAAVGSDKINGPVH